MRKTLLTLNYIALLFSFGVWFYVSTFAALGGPVRVTELDRNQVFNEQELQEYDSKLAENLRNNVGRWIQGPVKEAAVFNAFAIGMIATLNIVGLHLLGRKNMGAPPVHLEK
ncbi:MAG: hypothetical protein GY805_08160 [Chloroflexi bacterium]|nr:hypothetical protein [Chloroflexota bacterium]